jgi:hypothetical protein
LLLRGVLGAVAITYFVGIAGAGASLATLIQNTYPIFAALLASVFLREAFTTARHRSPARRDRGGAHRGAESAALRLHFQALAAACAAVLSGGAITAAWLRYSGGDRDHDVLHGRGRPGHGTGASP